MEPITATKTEAMIDLRNVSRWYGSFQALRDVTFQLAPGRIGLLGPNGAGKSTLLKILLGLLPPSSGDGCVLGQTIGQDGASLRRAIGYMPEADALIPVYAGPNMSPWPANCTACRAERPNVARTKC